MSRDHICFIQAQSLAWTSAAVAGREVERKVLSRDPENGACTLLLRYPAGWQEDTSHSLDCAEEILVLSGGLQINDQDYGHHGYAYLPAGLPRNTMASESGAVVLTMFDADPVVSSGWGEIDYASHIPHLDPYHMPWLSGVEGSVTGKGLSNGLATKLLRRDLETGEQSFLYSAYAHHPPPGIMVGKFGHPMVEEIFVLGGEFAFADLGTMRAGGYCWWREGIYHGPVGSQMGYLMFIRNLEGPLQNEFPQEPYPFTYTPEHRPSVPDGLEPFAGPAPKVDRW